jgi:hypothetical protein
MIRELSFSLIYASAATCANATPRGGVGVPIHVSR